LVRLKIFLFFFFSKLVFLEFILFISFFIFLLVFFICYFIIFFICYFIIFIMLFYYLLFLFFLLLNEIYIFSTYRLFFSLIKKTILTNNAALLTKIRSFKNNFYNFLRLTFFSRDFNFYKILFFFLFYFGFFFDILLFFIFFFFFCIFFLCIIHLIRSFISFFRSPEAVFIFYEPAFPYPMFSKRAFFASLDFLEVNYLIIIEVFIIEKIFGA
jgi:hypothetical protein